MGDTNGQIKAALMALLDAIRRSDGVVVSREMEKLEGILVRDRPSLAPQLAHFIERRSYAKALAYLEAEGAA